MWISLETFARFTLNCCLYSLYWLLIVFWILYRLDEPNLPPQGLLAYWSALFLNMGGVSTFQAYWPDTNPSGIGTY